MTQVIMSAENTNFANLLAATGAVDELRESTLAWAADYKQPAKIENRFAEIKGVVSEAKKALTPPSDVEIEKLNDAKSAMLTELMRRIPLAAGDAKVDLQRLYDRLLVATGREIQDVLNEARDAIGDARESEGAEHESLDDKIKRLEDRLAELDAFIEKAEKDNTQDMRAAAEALQLTPQQMDEFEKMGEHEKKDYLRKIQQELANGTPEQQKLAKKADEFLDKIDAREPEITKAKKDKEEVKTDLDELYNERTRQVAIVQSAGQETKTKEEEQQAEAVANTEEMIEVPMLVAANTPSTEKSR